MKKLLLILIMISSTLFANSINEYKIDIYYGNGVWNDSEDAKISIEYLETLHSFRT